MVIARNVFTMRKSLTRKVEMTFLVKFQKKTHIPICISLACDFSLSSIFYHNSHFPFAFQ